jgi:hypothetical protein
VKIQIKKIKRENMTTVGIKAASFENIERFAAIGLLGKRRTGKTTWAKEILKPISKHCDRFAVMSGNKDNMEEWALSVSRLFVMEKSIDQLEKIRDYQNNKCAPYRRDRKEIPKKITLTLIFDDCGSDRAFMHHKVMKDILSNGRHYGMYLLFLCQCLTQMNSQNRDQLDYLGMLFTSNQKAVKMAHEEYGNVVDLRTFKYTLRALTIDHGLCWIDNTVNPTNISECIFHKRMKYPPDEIPIFGSHQVRTYGEEHLEKKKKKKKHINNMFQQLTSNPATVNVDTDGEDDEGDIIADYARVTYSDRKGKIIIQKYMEDEEKAPPTPPPPPQRKFKTE